MIGYWHDNVVGLSVRLSVWRCALGLNDRLHHTAKISEQQNKWIGSAPLENDFSTCSPTSTLSAQKLKLRCVMIVRKSYMKQSSIIETSD